MGHWPDLHCSRLALFQTCTVPDFDCSRPALFQTFSFLLFLLAVSPDMHTVGGACSGIVCDQEMCLVLSFPAWKIYEESPKNEDWQGTQLSIQKSLTSLALLATAPLCRKGEGSWQGQA